MTEKEAIEQERVRQFKTWRALVKASPNRYRIVRIHSYGSFHIRFALEAYEPVGTGAIRKYYEWNTIDMQKYWFVNHDSLKPHYIRG